MTIEQLKLVLTGFGIGPDIVQFGGLPNEAFVVEPFQQGWRTFYSERGGRSSESWYATEAEAVDGLLLMLAGDSSIRLART